MVANVTKKHISTNHNNGWIIYFWFLAGGVCGIASYIETFFFNAKWKLNKIKRKIQRLGGMRRDPGTIHKKIDRDTLYHKLYRNIYYTEVNQVIYRVVPRVLTFGVDLNSPNFFWIISLKWNTVSKIIETVHPWVELGEQILVFSFLLSILFILLFFGWIVVLNYTWLLYWI